MKIRKMIGNLDRSVQPLNSDIASEEERTRLSDPSDAACLFDPGEDARNSPQ